MRYFSQFQKKRPLIILAKVFLGIAHHGKEVEEVVAISVRSYCKVSC